jgi:hypothetical protein
MRCAVNAAFLAAHEGKKMKNLSCTTIAALIGVAFATAALANMLFFGWLWGVWGLLLGVPLVAIAKVTCERVESPGPVGKLLGH